MNLYSIALFVHIVGALLLFVLLTIEGVSLRAGIAAGQLNRVLGLISGLAILVPGLYLVAAGTGWKGWVAVGFTSWALIVVVGAVTGVILMRGRPRHRSDLLDGQGGHGGGRGFRHDGQAGCLGRDRCGSSRGGHRRHGGCRGAARASRYMSAATAEAQTWTAPPPGSRRWTALAFI